MSAQAGPAEQALRAAVESSCAIQVAREVAAAALSSELDHWLDPSVPPDELDGLVLARLVTHEVRWVGKHFLRARPARAARRRQGPVRRSGPATSTRSSTASSTSTRVASGTAPTCRCRCSRCSWPSTTCCPSGIAALLAADIVRYELCAAHRLTDVSPVGRPDPRTLRTRVRHSLRFMTAHLGSAESEGLLAAIAHEPEADLPTLLLQLPIPPIALAGEWLELTVQPVSTVHDEYFFMRVLQAHEMAFTGMNRRMRDAIAALRDEQLDPATSLLEEVVTFMDRNALAVPHRRDDALRGVPHLPRVHRRGERHPVRAVQAVRGAVRPAAGGPPGVAGLRQRARRARRGQRRAGHDDRRLPRRRCAAGRHPAELATIAALLRTLEDSHRRWKSTHVTLATRMLGDARGSGHTSGVGYLSEWVDHRLFWRLPEIGVTDTRRRAAGRPAAV